MGAAPVARIATARCAVPASADVAKMLMACGATIGKRADVVARVAVEV